MGDRALPVLGRARAVTERVFRLGEGPVYDDRRGVLFWVDIEAGEVWRADVEGEGGVWGLGEPRLVASGPRVGGLTIEDNGSLVLFRERDVVVVGGETEGDGGEVRELARLSDAGAERFNDVMAMPDGSVLAGTIGVREDSGGLCEVRRSGGSVVVSERFQETRTKVANGMGLVDGGSGVLWTDTPARLVWRYPVGSDGRLVRGERRVMIDASESASGWPDGLCVDSGGRVYSARWGGGCVVVHDGSGEAVGVVEVDAENVTSAAFGGPTLETLFVTTAGGPVFAADVGARGVAECRSSLG